MSEENNNPEETGKINPEEEAKKILQDKEANSELEYEEAEEVKADPPRHLGIAEKVQREEESREHGKKLAAEMGMKGIPMEDLPSAGIFYPEGTEVAIKAANVGEIRHFSTIDENDPLDVDDKLNFIVDKCLKVKMPDRMANWKDLKEEDRFFLIFAIRDLTFKLGENKIMVPTSCQSCGHADKIEVKSGIFDYYKIEGTILKYFSDEERCFVINSKKAGDFKLYVPSLGITNFVKNYIRDRARSKEHYDKAFLKVAPFMFNDWRALNESNYRRLELESKSWSPAKFSAITIMVEKIRFGVKLGLTSECSACGSGGATDLTFPDGIRSLFVITNLDELL